MNSQQDSFEEIDILTSKVFDGDFTESDFTNICNFLKYSKDLIKSDKKHHEENRSNY